MDQRGKIVLPKKTSHFLKCVMLWVPMEALRGNLPDILGKMKLPRDAILLKDYPNPEKNEIGLLLMHQSFKLVAKDDIPYITYQG